MKFFKHIEPGEMLPRAYGVCWKDYSRRETVTCPIPLNIPIAIAYRLWWWAKNPIGTKKRLDYLIVEAESRGYQRGYNEGRY